MLGIWLRGNLLVQSLARNGPTSMWWPRSIVLHTYMPRDFLTLNTLMQNAFAFLHTVASSKKTTGWNTQSPLLWIKEVSLQRSMSAGCQNYTQLKKTNQTIYASWMWDREYEWVTWLSLFRYRSFDVVCGHCLVSLSITSYWNMKMALIAADLNAEIILVVTVKR